MDTPAPVQSNPTVQSAPVTAPSSPQPPVSPSPMTSPKQSDSSSKGLIVSIIIVLVVVVAVGVYAFMSKQSPNSIDSQTVATKTSSMPHLSVSPSQAMKMNSATQSNGLTSGTTNADLTQDASTLNKQLDSASSEMNNADQGLNDKPADLSQ